MDDPSGPWKQLQPMFGTRWPIRCGHVFTVDDLIRLREGLWPRDVEDRWAVWLDGDTLRCWLSFTGTCIYETRVTLAEDGTGVAGVLDVLDDDSSTYRRASTDEGELERFEGVLSQVRRRESEGDALAGVTVVQEA